MPGRPHPPQAGDRAITEFHLRDGGARHAELLGDVLLGQPARFARLPQSPAQFGLIDGMLRRPCGLPLKAGFRPSCVGRVLQNRPCIFQYIFC
jgi:hypothetical protein